MNPVKVLVVDDDRAMRLALLDALRSCGSDVVGAAGGREALSLFRRSPFDLVITDLRMAEMSGIDLLRSVKKLSAKTPVILITAFGTVGTAVEAMKDGAADFLMKPFSLEELEAIVARVLKGARQESAGPDPGGRSPQRIVTRDPGFLSILEMLKTVAQSRSSVMIEGESGTGKELLARYVHHQSQRRNGPFVAVNCAAIPQNLLESEMFGYERGAFTGAAQRKAGRFELASTGTLLLDEVGEMDIQLQAKLLRVIQESEVDRLGGNGPVPIDVRYISTTNVDLPLAVQQKRFRSDLYYRLNVIPVKIPPLRERNGDILYLAGHFLERLGGRNGGPVKRLSAKAASLLVSYPFPGNVRELENILERAALMTAGETIEAGTLGIGPAAGPGPGLPVTERPAAPTAAATGQPTTLRDAERQLICETLGRVDGNRTEAAKLLGISVRTLWNKLSEYNSAATGER